MRMKYALEEMLLIKMQEVMCGVRQRKIIDADPKIRSILKTTKNRKNPP